MNIAIIQAHMGSKRLPGKIMKKILNKEVLLHVYDRCFKSEKLDKIVIATSKDKENDVIERMCDNHNIECFRGEENDVLDRYYECAKRYNPNIIVRVTSDCPLLEPKLIDYWLEKMEKDNIEFIKEEETLYNGFGLDIFSMEALVKLKKMSTNQNQREHVVGYYLENKDKFEDNVYPLREDLSYLYRNYRLTLDTVEDFELITKLYEKFYFDGFIDLAEVIKFIDHNSEVMDINRNIIQKKY